eukprot:Gb_16165 [translate_table: standard]
MESRKASKMVDIIRRWHKLASSGLLSRRRKSWSSDVPADVPEGHLAVYVGRECKRFVIQTGYVNHPLFRLLLEKAEEEFGVKPNQWSAVEVQPGPPLTSLMEGSSSKAFRTWKLSAHLLHTPSQLQVKDWDKHHIQS